jgi:lycopene cyclase domain-containing protein
MRLYTLLNLLILAGPFFLSFDKKVAFYKRWPALFGSTVIVGTLFIVWDVIVTDIGHWSFSEQFAGTFRIFLLPPGEWLFFIVVPYACIFIYECVRAYTKERTWNVPLWIYAVLFLGGLSPLIFFPDRGYTVINGIVFSNAVLLVVFFVRKKFNSSWTLISLLISYMPFIIFNGIFTGLPIVSYNPDAIIGLRITTIPVEDFIYSLTLLTMGYTVYFLLRDVRFKKKGKADS